VPKPLTVTQQYDSPASAVFALFNDPDFIAGRLEDSGAPDAKVMTVDSSADGVKIVTRQSIPASVLPSMVASMIQGDPATERTEDWRVDGDSYVADFSVIVKGAPATIKGTMTLSPAGEGSTLVVDGQAAVPIPLFGSKIEAVIAEQIGALLASEETYTRSKLV
jgi:hypothetical protein